MLFPSSIWINRKCTFFAHHKKKMIPNLLFQQGHVRDKNWTRLWWFFNGYFLSSKGNTINCCNLLNLLHRSTAWLEKWSSTFCRDFFCHSELHQYVWGNSQMPRNNALWKCLFFFCCLFLQWLVYSCYWGPKTNIDRSNNAYSKYARFGARRGLAEEVFVEVLNLATFNWSRK